MNRSEWKLMRAKSANIFILIMGRPKSEVSITIYAIKIKYIKRNWCSVNTEMSARN
jgi:hypothetical protein